MSPYVSTPAERDAAVFLAWDTQTQSNNGGLVQMQGNNREQTPQNLKCAQACIVNTAMLQDGL